MWWDIDREPVELGRVVVVVGWEWDLIFAITLLNHFFAWKVGGVVIESKWILQVQGNKTHDPYDFMKMHMGEVWVSVLYMDT